MAFIGLFNGFEVGHEPTVSSPLMTHLETIDNSDNRHKPMRPCEWGEQHLETCMSKPDETIVCMSRSHPGDLVNVARSPQRICPGRW